MALSLFELEARREELMTEYFEISDKIEVDYRCEICLTGKFDCATSLDKCAKCNKYACFKCLNYANRYNAELFCDACVVEIKGWENG